MFVKLTQSGPRSYVQLVESFRDEAGRVKKRTVATLGRVEQLAGELDSVIDGLSRIAGRPAPPPGQAIATESLSFEVARAYGNVWALTQLWNELGFGDLKRVFRRNRYTVEVEGQLRVMVINRLCDPESKLGVLRWLQTVTMPEVDTVSITHQQLLRSMDALIDHQDSVDTTVAALLRPLVDQDLSVVFYDLTTIRSEGLSQLAGDVRHYGMAKEGLIARQFMLGVVQTADGLPIHHEVFEGNVAETKTLLPTIAKVLKRYPNMRRVVLIADRGLLSLDNLEALQGITLAGHQPLEFIIAVPGRRYNEFTELLQPWQQQCESAQEELVHEQRWNGLRLVMAHDPARALEQRTQRQAKLQELHALAQQWAGKLEAQDGGHRSCGRRLSDSGAKARFYHAVCEAHMGKIIKVDLRSELFSYTVDEQALQLAQTMDGKLLLVTNVTDMTPRQVKDRYKALADIERGFKVLKSELEIGPVFHRLPQRIRAHASICFMALILHRVMRMRLKAAPQAEGISPETALELLQQIQHHRVSINGSKPLSGLSSMSKLQSTVLKALKVRQPSHDPQMSLL
jgi:transposase